MAEIIIYSTAHCPFCVQARNLFQRKGIDFQEIRVDESPEKRDEMIAKTQRRTVPQIFINGQYIGGCTDLYALDFKGKLDELLEDKP
jgi:glutaredoxin 3